MDSLHVMKILEGMTTRQIHLAVDDDQGRVYITPKFGRDRKPRCYLVSESDSDIREEILKFDNSL